MAIDPIVSERYGIVPYGPAGVEVQRNGQVAKFTTWPTVEQNWLEAVAWCKEQEK